MQLKQTLVDNKRFLYGRVLSNGWHDYERTRLDRYRPSGNVFLFNSFMSGFSGVMSFLNCPIYYDKQAYMEIKIYAKTRKESKGF